MKLCSACGSRLKETASEEYCVNPTCVLYYEEITRLKFLGKPVKTDPAKFPSKWSQLLSLLAAIKMIDNILEKLSANNRWVEQEEIISALKSRIENNYQNASGYLQRKDYGNMLNWLSARYTDFEKYGKVWNHSEWQQLFKGLVEKYERKKIAGRWVYRLKIR